MELKTLDDRDILIFGAVCDEYEYGIRYFNEMTTQEMRMLLGAGLADPDMQQNYSPTIAEFVDFCEEWNNKYSVEHELRMHGYVVDPTREDTRVSVEGLTSGVSTRMTPDMFHTFVKFNSGADELNLTPCLRSWWD